MPTKSKSRGLPAILCIVVATLWTTRSPMTHQPHHWRPPMFHFTIRDVLLIADVFVHDTYLRANLPAVVAVFAVASVLLVAAILLAVWSFRQRDENA